MGERIKCLQAISLWRFIGCLVVLAVFCSFPRPAGAGWLEKGSSLLKGMSQGAAESDALSRKEVGAGLKEALRVGTQRVVEQLGVTGGFNLDPRIHIPLPDTLSTVQSVLKKAGLSGMLDDLEHKLNRAAELAVPKAKTLFGEAIAAMTFQDVMDIYNGPDDAATRYFQEKMTPGLVTEMRPIVDSTLEESGAVQAYDQVMGKYNAFPFVPDVSADLTGYTVEKGLDGLFYYVAEEEAAIRNDPLARSTDLLKRVFGR